MRTNQGSTSLPSLPRWKKNESSLFQLIVAGSFDKVKRFWRFLKSFSGYRLSGNYCMSFDQLDRKEDLHVVMQVEETPYILSKVQQKESKVQIETIYGKKIEFPLLNTQVVEMLNGMVYVQGKSYDIFANPIYDRKSEMEVVACKVVNAEEDR